MQDGSTTCCPSAPLGTAALRGRTRGLRTPPLHADRSRMACDLTKPPSPPPPSPVTLLQLPEDVLLLVAIPLGPVDLSSLACATRALKLPARVWRLFLERTFGDVPSAQRALHQAPCRVASGATELGVGDADHRSLFAFLAFGVRTPNAVPKLLGHCPLLAPPDEDGSLPLVELGCGGSLVLRPLSSREQRCPCVAVRTPQLPLQLASLGRARSACLGSGGFSSMLSSLRRHFTCGEARPKPHPPATRLRAPLCSQAARAAATAASHHAALPHRSAAARAGRQVGRRARCARPLGGRRAAARRGSRAWRAHGRAGAGSACLPASLPPCLPASLPPCRPASLPPCLPPCLSGSCICLPPTYPPVRLPAHPLPRTYLTRRGCGRAVRSS